ncbi:MAG: hypothetical protein PVH10_00925 [Methyloceanibacter sp.]|jgi:hypothetical protein
MVAIDGHEITAGYGEDKAAASTENISDPCHTESVVAPRRRCPLMTDAVDKGVESGAEQ